MNVADVVDRTLRFLEPPDEAWVRATLSAAVDDVQTSWTVDVATLSPQDRQITPGTLAEAGSEQVTVVGLSGSTMTVRRGVRGTDVAAHAAGAEVLIRPPFTRLACFEAIADEVEALHPPLSTAGSEEVEADGDGIVELPWSVLDPQSLRTIPYGNDVPYVDLGEWATGRALRTSCPGARLWLNYRGRPCRPLSEKDALPTLGVRDEWGRILMIGASAQLVAGKPMSAQWQEFVASSLRTEGYPVETPNRIRDALIRYREHLVAQAAGAVLARTPPQVKVVGL